MNLEPINKKAHTRENFKEQIAVLYFAGQTENEVTLLRSLVQVCQPGLASFDDIDPGADTFESWILIDQLIECHDVVGIFHTHPPYCSDFSSQDIAAQNGLAKSNGRKKIWHGIQPWDYPVGKSLFVCTWMLHGRVFRCVYDLITDDLKNPVIRLPQPYDILWNDLHGAYEL